MWEPECLTTLWATSAKYTGSFTFTLPFFEQVIRNVSSKMNREVSVLFIRSRLHALLCFSFELKMSFSLWSVWLVFKCYQIFALKNAVHHRGKRTITLELLGFQILSIVQIPNNYKKNMTFSKLDVFPSSGEGRHLLCWVPQKELTSITGADDGQSDWG
jgi:hypothetical protein